MGAQRGMVPIVGDQQTAQKATVPRQKGKARSLEEVSLQKASPKSRSKVCKGESYTVLCFQLICLSSVDHFCAFLQFVM